MTKFALVEEFGAPSQRWDHRPDVAPAVLREQHPRKGIVAVGAVGITNIAKVTAAKSGEDAQHFADREPTQI